MRLKISQYAKMEGVKYRAIWNRIKKGQLKEDIGEKETYMGRRISRGLFKSKNGIIINADINGSGNIMRKAIPNCGIDTANGIEGFVVSPVRITPKGYYPYKQVS